MAAARGALTPTPVRALWGTPGPAGAGPGGAGPGGAEPAGAGPAGDSVQGLRAVWGVQELVSSALRVPALVMIDTALLHTAPVS